jgi:hypothetical protein
MPEPLLQVACDGNKTAPGGKTRAAARVMRLGQRVSPPGAVAIGYRLAEFRQRESWGCYWQQGQFFLDRMDCMDAKDYFIEMIS